jgi:hypothetical protein
MSDIQQSKKQNRFRNRPVLASFIITILLLFLLEGLSQVALWIRDSIKKTNDTREVYVKEYFTKDGIDPTSIHLELKHIYHDSAKFHPYRWYSPPVNFRGKYFQTDDLGYRIQEDVSQIDKSIIGCYGGSTMFSIFTDQSGTIPSCINNLNLLPDSLHALNFGIGAYASSTELITFIETSRHYQVKHALFLDGVNEVASVLYRLMDNKEDDMVYDYWNYPYYPPLLGGFLNVLNSIESDYVVFRLWDLPKPALYWVSVSLIGKVSKLFPSHSALNADVQERWTEEDYEKAGRYAARLYLNNIRDIKTLADAKGIRTYFILQPTLFSTNKVFNEMELSIKNDNHSSVKSIHAYIYKYIKEADKGDLNFIDLSDAWDDLPPGDYFFDWNHVNKKANEHLSKKIAVAIRNS